MQEGGGSSGKGGERGGSLGRLEVLPATLPLGVIEDSSSSLSLPKGSCLQHKQHLVTVVRNVKAKCGTHNMPGSHQTMQPCHDCYRTPRSCLKAVLVMCMQ